jgi:hypothetical protein
MEVFFNPTYSIYDWQPKLLAGEAETCAFRHYTQYRSWTHFPRITGQTKCEVRSSFAIRPKASVLGSQLNMLLWPTPRLLLVTSRMSGKTHYEQTASSDRGKQSHLWMSGHKYTDHFPTGSTITNNVPQN